MGDLWKTHGSFLFGTVDMYETYGIKMASTSIPKDVLIPSIRARKVTIPQRHGSYDYGAKFYDERSIQIDCVTCRTISREETREIAFTLSQKTEIRFWTEPEKYYVGRVYTAPNLDQLRNAGNKFSLTFICEPFAYGVSKTEYFKKQKYVPNYHGTAATATYIVITNIAASGNVSNIKLVQTDKEENY